MILKSERSMVESELWKFYQSVFFRVNFVVSLSLSLLGSWKVFHSTTIHIIWSIRLIQFEKDCPFDSFRFNPNSPHSCVNRILPAIAILYWWHSESSWSGPISIYHELCWTSSYCWILCVYSLPFSSQMNTRIR